MNPRCSRFRMVVGMRVPVNQHTGTAEPARFGRRPGGTRRLDRLIRKAG
jgi:hypothetical protein